MPLTRALTELWKRIFHSGRRAEPAPTPGPTTNREIRDLVESLQVENRRLHRELQGKSNAKIANTAVASSVGPDEGALTAAPTALASSTQVGAPAPALPSRAQGDTTEVGFQVTVYGCPELQVSELNQWDLFRRGLTEIRDREIRDKLIAEASIQTIAAVVAANFKISLVHRPVPEGCIPPLNRQTGTTKTILVGTPPSQATMDPAAYARLADRIGGAAYSSSNSDRLYAALERTQLVWVTY